MKPNERKAEDENVHMQQQRNTTLHENRTPRTDINNIKKNEGCNESNKKNSESNKLSNRRAIFQTQK